MPVIGMTFTNMQATRKKGFDGDVKINSTPQITDVKEINVTQLGKKALDMKFEFLTSYEPDIGEVRVDGNLVYLSDKNREILKRWKDKKEVDEEISVELLNHLFRRCLLKIANLADELQLPPPLQLPKVTKSEGKK